MQTSTPPKAACADACTAAAITALQHRARTGLLINAIYKDRVVDTFDFWQGYAKSLGDIKGGTGARLAAKDAKLPYEAPRDIQRAAQALNNDVDLLTRSQICDRLTQAGFKLTPNTQADFDVVTALQLEDGVIAPVNPNGEHAAPAVVANDGSGLHIAPCAVVSPIVPLTPPAIGQPWPGQGGVYIGICRGDKGQPDQHMVLVTAAPEIKGPWGQYGQDVPGAASRFDGRANTAAMAAAGSPIAIQVMALEVEGHKDLFIGSQAQMALAAANAPEQFATGYHWTSTQFSRFDAFVQDFEDGGSNWGDKDSERRVRAFRGLTLENLTTSAVQA